MIKSIKLRKLRGQRVIIGDEINFYRIFLAFRVITDDKINRIKEMIIGDKINTI